MMAGAVGGNGINQQPRQDLSPAPAPDERFVGNPANAGEIAEAVLDGPWPRTPVTSTKSPRRALSRWPDTAILGGFGEVPGVGAKVRRGQPPPSRRRWRGCQPSVQLVQVLAIDPAGFAG